MKLAVMLALFLTFSFAFATIEIDFDLMDFSPKNVADIHQGHKEIILTFDDGPIPGVTNRVLDILADYNIKATFFVIGQNVIAHPHLMKRMVEEGHTVGNHSMSHMALKNLDPLTWKETVQREVMEAHDVISPYMVNNRHYFFRAPYAAWAQHYAEFLNESEVGREYKGPILWDLGGEIEFKNGKYLQAADWECWFRKISVNDCMSGYLNEAIRRRGGVVLMHDLRRQSVEMLEKLIPELQDRGFIFTTLNDVNWR